MRCGVFFVSRKFHKYVPSNERTQAMGFLKDLLSPFTFHKYVLVAQTSLCEGTIHLTKGEGGCACIVRCHLGANN